MDLHSLTLNQEADVSQTDRLLHRDGQARELDRPIVPLESKNGPGGLRAFLVVATGTQLPSEARRTTQTGNGSREIAVEPGADSLGMKLKTIRRVLVFNSAACN